VPADGRDGEAADAVPEPRLERGGPEEPSEYYPHLGSLSMRELLPGAPPGAPPEPEVNLFLLPPLEEEPEDALPRGGGGALFPALPPFRGRGGLGGLLARLRGRVLAAARSQLSHSLLTERNWFHYAARIWDGVKKSSALAEYGRLLG
ncbi:nonsense-mediated mRNA decay factor SMG9-like, partial [Ammospiza maritima maritima]